LNRFGNTNDPIVANGVAWSCAVGPEALPDLKKAVALARLAVRTQPKNANIRNTLGAILYRDGQYKDAVRELNESLKLRIQPLEMDYLFLAMTHHQLGQQDEAQTWLDKAVQNSLRIITLFGNDLLELQLIRREAETLIRRQASGEKK
jgi:Flp pilus assembly protein TadD